jgi:addiction module RelE/StbE family toxin
MKLFKMRFTPEASRLLAKIHPENKKMIRHSLNGLREDPYIGNQLSGELSGFRSLKVKRYRVVYGIHEEENLIDILYVGHRREIYEQFRTLLTKLQ